ncbi:YjbQ family protein [candidate division KSB1 bacterium]|nr:YjbQ family protein [candidate division KSB1 bacterium]
MKVRTENIHISSEGKTDIIDITHRASTLLEQSELSNGTVTFFASGSTAGITTIEYEPGLIQDIPLAFEKIAPMGQHYYHNATWGDGNGYSHVRAALLGASLVVPFKDGRMLLGTWQQIVVIDFDNRARQRDIVMQIMGE